MNFKETHFLCFLRVCINLQEYIIQTPFALVPGRKAHRYRQRILTTIEILKSKSDEIDFDESLKLHLFLKV